MSAGQGPRGPQRPRTSTASWSFRAAAMAAAMAATAVSLPTQAGSTSIAGITAIAGNTSAGITSNGNTSTSSSTSNNNNHNHNMTDSSLLAGPTLDGQQLTSNNASANNAAFSNTSTNGIAGLSMMLVHEPRTIKCYCDHCANATCTVLINEGLCFTRFDQHNHVERNCWNYPDILVRQLVCDSNNSSSSPISESSTSSSPAFSFSPAYSSSGKSGHPIYKCCDTDFCNRDSEPPNPHWALSSTFTILLLLTIVVLIALTRRYISPRKRSSSPALHVAVSVHGDNCPISATSATNQQHLQQHHHHHHQQQHLPQQQQQQQLDYQRHTGHNNNIDSNNNKNNSYSHHHHLHHQLYHQKQNKNLYNKHLLHHHHPHHHHHNSPAKCQGSVDGTVCDTNSMASREPLISNSQHPDAATQQLSNGRPTQPLSLANQQQQQHLLQHHHQQQALCQQQPICSLALQSANQDSITITTTTTAMNNNICLAQNNNNIINNNNNTFACGLTHATNNSNLNNAALLNNQPWARDQSFSARSKRDLMLCTGMGHTRPEASSGSGAGQPYLTQRSIADDIILKEEVGRGYFGVVKRGDYKGEPVAVKIFTPVAEPSWEREAEIYQTTLFRHKNILGFVAADARTDGYWLVTDYYPLGSLFEFLRRNSISIRDAIRMAFSIANGLCHLHVEIHGTHGTQGKPAIAHRDIKSRNILVRTDGTCCIADLGMAVRYYSASCCVDKPTNTRVGTRRYLAPEVLDDKLNLNDFAAVMATDIYALGLVLWEILRRTCMEVPLEQPARPAHMYGQTAKPPAPSQPATPVEAPEGALVGARSSVASSPSSSSKKQKNISSSSSSRNRSRGSSSSDSHDNESDSATTAAEQPLLKSEPTAAAAAIELASPPDPAKTGPAPLEPQPQVEPQAAPPPPPPPPPPPQQPAQPAALDGGQQDDCVQELFAVVCDPYEVPYQHDVPSEPSIEDMRQVVCVRKVRPPMSPRWSKFRCMDELSKLMRECWYDKSQARHTALRVRKTVSDIGRFYYGLNMEYD